MFNIATYLEKFKKIGFTESSDKEAIVGVLQTKIGIKIEKKDIRIQNGIVYIQTHPLAKNQIYIKKTALLGELSSKLSKPISDIK